MQRIICQVTLGAAESTVVIDNVNYSPDIVRDVVNRAKEALHEAVHLSVEVGLPEYQTQFEEVTDLFDQMMEGVDDGDE